MILGYVQTRIVLLEIRGQLMVRRRLGEFEGEIQRIPVPRAVDWYTRSTSGIRSNQCIETSRTTQTVTGKLCGLSLSSRIEADYIVLGPAVTTTSTVTEHPTTGKLFVFLCIRFSLSKRGEWCADATSVVH